ncbi:PTS sugar transporter, partial [Salmonella enterica subsp. enterica serovar Montevideo]|nr:PTS sugar transporter [Salmonella enterica subsp. enterica serovar Montevideo]
VNVAAVQFIAAEASMDVAKPDTPASVYALTTENQQKPQRIFQQNRQDVRARRVNVIQCDYR